MLHRGHRTTGRFSEGEAPAVEELFAELDRAASASAILGYLNFSDGRPDPRWQKQLHDAFAFLADRDTPCPWDALRQWLASRLEALHTGGTAAFRDVTQARTFLVRVFEAILAQLAASAESGSHSVADVLARLNDFVGYRPMAVLETRPRGEPYTHERFRPVPL